MPDQQRGNDTPAEHASQGRRTEDATARARVREFAGAVASGQSVFFVGAGLSAAAGGPSWEDIVDRLRESLDPPTNEHSLPLVAQFFRNQHGDNRLFVELRRMFDAVVAPSAAHRILVSLPCRVFVTTNYDSLLEDSLRGAHRAVHIVVDDNELALWNETGQTEVLKIHGDLQRSKTIVFTEEDYVRFLQENRAIQRKLLDLFSFRTVVFIGFSMRDTDVALIYNQIAHELGAAKRPAYLLTFESDEHFKAEWERRKIFPISIPLIDNDRSASLEAYLRALHSQVNTLERRKGCDVLIVEDNEDSRTLLTTAFRAAHPELRIECASDGLEGLMLVGSLNPRLILLDVNMPRMSGWEVIERIRRDPRRSKTGVFLITAAAEEASGHVAETGLHVDGIFAKPYELSAIRARSVEYRRRRNASDDER
jgi:CheY-like chemotaxis protein